MTSAISSLVLVVVGLCVVKADVELSHMSTIYLPYTITPEPKYRTFSAQNQNYTFDIGGSVEQLTYDINNHVIYVAGAGILHIVNASDPNKMVRIKSIEMADVDLTDIEICDDVVFLTITNLTEHSIGVLQVYKIYDQNTDTMEMLHEVDVGSLPDMLHPRADCRTVVIAQEAEGYVDSKGIFHDPEGGVVIVKFPEGPKGAAAPTVKRLDFRKFNDIIDSYYPSGVRFVNRYNGNQFSNDVEPEYVALDEAGEKAYICLQENNAIAEVDLVTENITGMFGLGYKQWGHFDPSDKDDGIRIGYWPIRAWYLPDAIHFHEWQGRRLVFSANEGDAKNYDFFSEEIRGAKIMKSLIGDGIPKIVKEALSNDKELGRLVMSQIDGKDDNDQFQHLYTYGGRSFSVWDASDSMRQVYDSGSDIEESIALYCPHLFNEDGNNYAIDHRSDDKGPEPESITVVEEGDRLYVFIGNERPGIISVYSFGLDISDVRFETIFCDGIPDDKLSMQQKFAARELYAVDPEDLKYVPGEHSPSSHPILVVAGTVSGTVSLLKVDITDR